MEAGARVQYKQVLGRMESLTCGDSVRQTGGFPGGVRAAAAADDVISPNARAVVYGLRGKPVAMVTRDDTRRSERAQVPYAARVAVAATRRRLHHSQLRTHCKQFPTSA